MQSNSKPDIPAEDTPTKEQEALQAAGLADYRPLTTADLPGIAKFIQETSKPKRASAPARKPSAKKKGASK